MPFTSKTMTDKETSDLSMTRVECEHCGAVWINGQHRWQTGCTSKNSELDLAGLVCNTPHGNPKLCVNPEKGKEGGDTWESRLSFLDNWTMEMEDKQG